MQSGAKAPSVPRQFGSYEAAFLGTHIRHNPPKTPRPNSLLWSLLFSIIVIPTMSVATAIPFRVLLVVNAIKSQI